MTDSPVRRLQGTRLSGVTRTLRCAFVPLLALAAASTAGPVRAADGAAPPPEAAATVSARDKQVPGYYHQVIGDARVTALMDGVVPLPRQQLKGVTPQRIESLLDRRYVPESPKGMQTAVNAYLVERAGQVVLIDAGAAACFGDGLGQVLRNLRASGYRPEDVSAVLLTHAHPDHLCGVLEPQGAIAFPNATLWLARAEAEHWQDTKAEQAMPEGMRFLFGVARHALAPYEQAGRVKRFEANDTLPAGVQIVASPGHTPGHTSYLVDGGGAQKLLVWGDVLHYHAVQFAAPEASFEVDVNRAQAIASRKNLLAQAARHGWWVAGAHLPFPGLGHVRAEGKAFAWVPGEFSPLPGKP